MSKLSYAAAVGAVACILAAGSTANAQQLLNPGFYLGIHGGGDFLEQGDTHLKNGGTTLKGETDFDDGWLAGAEAGYEIPLNWAVPGDSVAIEEEFTYRDNGLKKFGSPGVISGLNGREDSYAVMTNGYYRYNTGTPITPYVGAGVGVAVSGLHGQSGLFPGASFNSTDDDFAYQGIAGVSYAFTPISLGLEYRYFGTTTPHFSDNLGGAIGPTKISADDHSHNVLLNLTYHFQ
jgi:opacity protein-like surface antigen